MQATETKRGLDRSEISFGGYSWRGGTREYPHRQDDDRDQIEEPPAEYWEQREWEQETTSTPPDQTARHSVDRRPSYDAAMPTDTASPRTRKARPRAR